MKPPSLIDHIGWDLWQATQRWKQDFDAAMAARGYAWIGEARGAAFRHIGRNGIDQTALPAHLGISKQAVQQLLDELQRDAIITRTPSKNDARRKRVMLTKAGLDALHAGNDAKQEIEARYAALLGPERLKALQQDLRELAALSPPDTTS